MNKKHLLIIIGLIISLAILISYTYQPSLPLSYLTEKYTDQNSRFITIDGSQVHYKIEGDSGDYLLLIHGTAASLHTYDAWTEQLHLNYKVIRLDLPAFGLTGPFADKDYSIAHYVSFIKTFLKQLAIDKVHIAGNSLGGHIATQFTLDYPGMVNKLILIDASGLPSGKDSPFIFRVAKNPVGSFIIKNTLPKFIIKKNIEAVYYNDSLVEPKLIDRYYELALCDGNRQAFIDRARTASKELTGLHELKAATLIMWGKEDEWIPVENAYKFQQLIPNNKLLIYDHAGHIPMEEIPLESLKGLEAFLSK